MDAHEEAAGVADLYCNCWLCTCCIDAGRGNSKPHTRFRARPAQDSVRMNSPGSELSVMKFPASDRWIGPLGGNATGPTSTPECAVGGRGPDRYPTEQRGSRQLGSQHRGDASRRDRYRSDDEVRVRLRRRRQGAGGPAGRRAPESLALTRYWACRIPPLLITTEACQAYLASGVEPDGLAARSRRTFRRWRRWAVASGPAGSCSSCRCDQGEAFDARDRTRCSTSGSAMEFGSRVWLLSSGDRRFAWTFWRLIQMFGKHGVGVPRAIRGRACPSQGGKGRAYRSRSDAAELQSLVEGSSGSWPRRSADRSQRTPASRSGLQPARCSSRERAVLYRRAERI